MASIAWFVALSLQIGIPATVFYFVAAACAAFLAVLSGLRVPESLLVFVTAAWMAIILFPAEDIGLLHDRPGVDALGNKAFKQDFVNLNRLTVALYEYFSHHYRFPPSVGRREPNECLVSWRVLLLPQLGYKQLYESYHFNEPRDSPHNQTLLSKMPAEYRSPNATTGGQCCYFALALENSVWESQENSNWNFIRRGHELANPLLLCSKPEVSGNWLEPKDIDSKLFAAINHRPEPMVNIGLDDLRPAAAFSNYVSQPILIEPNVGIEQIRVVVLSDFCIRGTVMLVGAKRVKTPWPLIVGAAAFSAWLIWRSSANRVSTNVEG